MCIEKLIILKLLEVHTSVMPLCCSREVSYGLRNTKSKISESYWLFIKAPSVSPHGEKTARTKKGERLCVFIQ